jgi:hypothetical protein
MPNSLNGWSKIIREQGEDRRHNKEAFRSQMSLLTRKPSPALLNVARLLAHRHDMILDGELGKVSPEDCGEYVKDIGAITERLNALVKEED